MDEFRYGVTREKVNLLTGQGVPPKEVAAILGISFSYLRKIMSRQKAKFVVTAGLYLRDDEVLPRRLPPPVPIPPLEDIEEMVRRAEGGEGDGEGDGEEGGI